MYFWGKSIINHFGFREKIVNKYLNISSSTFHKKNLRLYGILSKKFLAHEPIYIFFFALLLLVKLSLLIFFALFLVSFLCFLFSYHSSNYHNSDNNWRSLLFLETRAKRFPLLFAIAQKAIDPKKATTIFVTIVEIKK